MDAAPAADNLAAVRVPVLLAAALAAVAAAGCGEDDDPAAPPDPASERRDRPADPPPGWRTLKNRRAGFTLSVPRIWSVRKRDSATLIRSSDRLLAITVAADRSEPGRTTPARAYARQAFRALPGFRKLRVQRVRPVRRSRYRSARVDGRGTLGRPRRRQHITVAAFRRPGRVTYTVIAFGADVQGRPPHTGPLRTMLASLRGRPPAL